MKTAIFKDAVLQEQFEQDGFVKLQLFGVEQIEGLKELYASYFPEKVEAFFSSSYLDDYDRKQEICAKANDIVEDKLSDYFINYRLIGAAFLVKGIGQHSEMPMHQDWTIVDESKYFAVNIWTPLTETNESNGTIEVLKGSHKWNEALRAPTLPFFFDGFQERIKEKLTIIEAVPGEVVVLNQAIIHYSKANLSNEIRPAITIGVTSKEAPLIFHYWDKDQPGKIELFDQEDDFLLRFENFHEAIYKRPAVGVSKGFKEYEIPVMNDAVLESFIGPPTPVAQERKPSFFSRIFGR